MRNLQDSDFEFDQNDNETGKTSMLTIFSFKKQDQVFFRTRSLFLNLRIFEKSGHLIDDDKADEEKKLKNKFQVPQSSISMS